MSAATYDFRVNASIEQVWEAISECSEYENWNPFIVKVSGKMEEGHELDMACVTDSGKTIRGTAKVTANQHHSRLAWNLHSPIPGFRNWSVDFRLSETENQQTDLRIITNLTGLSFLVMGPHIEEIKDGFDRMATAMNKRFAAPVQAAA